MGLILENGRPSRIYFLVKLFYPYRSWLVPLCPGRFFKKSAKKRRINETRAYGSQNLCDLSSCQLVEKWWLKADWLYELV